jgi:hypothetical protein
VIRRAPSWVERRRPGTAIACTRPTIAIEHQGGRTRARRQNGPPRKFAEMKVVRASPALASRSRGIERTNLHSAARATLNRRAEALSSERSGRVDHYQ